MSWRARSLPFSLPLLLVLLTGVLASTSCGYRPLYAKAESPVDRSGSDAEDAEPTRLAIMAIRNDSPEPWLDRLVTDALRREMDARGALILVNDPVEADLVLRGRVRPLNIRSKSFSSFVAAMEYSVTVQLDLEVVRASGDIVRLDSAMLSESDVYMASADIEVTRTNRLEVIRRLSDRLASRIADSIELMERPLEIEEGST